MRLLLDTHALIWFLEDDPVLGVKARAAIKAVTLLQRPYISDVTAWEMAIKTALGKLRLPRPYEELFPSRLQALGFEMLPVRHAHFYELLTLPHHHRDPFDRLLIAQAKSEGLTLVSRDAHFAAYGVPLLW